MLEPDITRAIGDSESTMEFVGAFRCSFCNLGDGRRFCITCAGGPLATLCRSGEFSLSEGGAAGNLKVLENEFEALRVTIGIFGVLGVVVTPGLLLPSRAGNANSLELSCAAAGEESPPARGEGWVADRWPGEFTVATSAPSSSTTCTDGTWIRVGPAWYYL
jgi:hypothetical protein